MAVKWWLDPSGSTCKGDFRKLQAAKVSQTNASGLAAEHRPPSQTKLNLKVR